MTIDWTVRENVRAQLRVLVKRVPRRYGYPPDKQATANMALIYPWHSGLAGSRETAFELPLSGARRAVLSVVCIDIHNDPMRTVRGGILPDYSAARTQAQAHPL